MIVFKQRKSVCNKMSSARLNGRGRVSPFCLLPPQIFLVLGYDPLTSATIQQTIIYNNYLFLLSLVVDILLLKQLHCFSESCLSSVGVQEEDE